MGPQRFSWQLKGTIEQLAMMGFSKLGTSQAQPQLRLWRLALATLEVVLGRQACRFAALWHCGMPIGCSELRAVDIAGHSHRCSGGGCLRQSGCHIPAGSLCDTKTQAKTQCQQRCPDCSDALLQCLRDGAACATSRNLWAALGSSRRLGQSAEYGMPCCVVCEEITSWHVLLWL